MNNTNSIKLDTKYVISYIDMLGTTARIRGNNSEASFFTIKNIYEQMINVFTTGGMEQEHIKVKIFSDNIIIARQTAENVDAIVANLNQMIALAATFQFFSMVSGWPVRGGITIGDLYLDDTFVWGKGLLRSYELESKVAVAPRIVIDPMLKTEVLDKFTVHCWRKDAGLPIVDYLSMCHNEQTMETVKNPILSLLKNSNEMTVGKIEWLKDDFNRACQEKQYHNLIIAD